MRKVSKANDHSKYPNWIDPDKVIPYEKNAKRHTEKQIKNIANSIKRFGWQQDVVITSDNVLVIGHGRRLAALEIGCQMPYHVIDKKADELTEEDIRELRIADNQTNSETDFDFDLLTEDADGLDFEGFDFDFNLEQDDEEEEYETTQATEDEIPVNVESRCHLGDIWQLGNHRLFVGDSTNSEDIASLMNGEKAKMLFTSPPYSDMREYEGGKNLDVDHLALFIAQYRPYTDYQCVNLGIQRRDNDIVEYWNDYIRVARESGYKMLAWNVWDKGLTGNIGQAKAFFPLRHEWVFVFGTEFFEINLTQEKLPKSITDNPSRKTKRNKDGTTSYHTAGDTSKPYKQMESVLFMYPVLDNNTRALHPAQFPVGLPLEYIKAMSNPNDIIIEPFGGAGTTLIACEQLNRKCRIMELEPKYADVIIKRWENFTGQKAVLLNG